MTTLHDMATAALAACGATTEFTRGDLLSRTPLTGENLLAVDASTQEETEAAIAHAAKAFRRWREVPAPARGAVVKRWGELLREHKRDLATLVQIEAGKSMSEAEGEVQEMIDICDFAVGQSRMLYGKTMPSERPGHRLMETWHPVGVVGVISAFNFPVAVYSWNTAIALVCGNTVVWKPSEMCVLSALGAHGLLRRAVLDCDQDPEIHQLVLGAAERGEQLVDDPRVALVSATGSTRMGREVAPRVAARFGRYLLELGGNNAGIVTPSARLDLALRGIVFAAAGTAGQRCTTMRRLIVHESVAEELIGTIVEAYRSLTIGDPRDESVLVGPLINEAAMTAMQDALRQAEAEGGEILIGGERVLVDANEQSFYVEPAVVRMPAQSEVVRTETFAPILYVLTYTDFEEALEMHNAVPQGLSSAIFTQDQAEAELFLSAGGSDCGIANVNIGTSGAEIGGAFGGEKDTGGGRESGSDAWKAYMRRATNTVNYGGELPLAQGVKFL
ncbi:Succinate-semialdehyde dehydrogenase [NADP(+)] [Corynebacterium ciconiae DSM 44920]|uniref:L-piperidine-6-carboxylate dehydrogenase n=1 Tax=Corynebacterium ciconiae TaxID=227319 RepID=UPI00035FEE5E|nr:aldehyde dehydrogenase family protein [Corynebacterium ciconiae]WKD60299.1 Succinate-semialdehyde dehydrogenase [NADP(+)] [Corynebacterium ciconiae DSM 44920]